MPVRVICCPFKDSSTLRALGIVSVVIMACAAFNQLSACNWLNASGNTLVILSTGNGCPITPVEKGNTVLASHWPILATASQHAFAATNPASPVPALAFPEFINRKRVVDWV